jgi:hypothetical protein
MAAASHYLLMHLPSVDVLLVVVWFLQKKKRKTIGNSKIHKEGHTKKWWVGKSEN